MQPMNRYAVQLKALPALILVAITMLAGCGPEALPPVPTRTTQPTFTPAVQEDALPVDPAAVATAQAVAIVNEALQVQEAAGQEGQAPGGDNASQPVEVGEVVVEEAVVEEVAVEEPPAEPAEALINSNMNVRGGPGTNYNIVGGANQGERYPVTGKSTDGTWWQLDYNGQVGWVFGELVSTQGVESVQVAQNIPAPPPIAVPVPPTSVPAPAEPAAPEPAAPAPAPAPVDNFPFLLIDDFVKCDPNAGNTYFKGYVRNRDNSPKNAVCIHIGFYGPRNTKCSGCDGVGDGNWGFSPFGGPAPSGTPVQIFVVGCPPSGVMPKGGETEQSGFSDLTPQSATWSRTIGDSEQCAEITFVQK
jgi:uncharacterized protein YraI